MSLRLLLDCSTSFHLLCLGFRVWVYSYCIVSWWEEGIMYIRGLNPPLPFSFSFLFTQCLVSDSAPALLTTLPPPQGNPLLASLPFRFFCLLHPEASDQGPSTQLQELLRPTRYDIPASLTTHHTPLPVLSPLRKRTWWPHLPLLFGRPACSLSKPPFDS
jgi:hypothetical protein